MQSSMSPAQQYQASQSFFLPSTPGSMPLPHQHVSPFSYTPPSVHSHTKYSPHFSPVRPEPLAATGSWTGHSQISSPASLDSAGDTSSPSSPLSPGSRQEQWYQPHTTFYNNNPNFPPPNTVAPPSELHPTHRPDAVFGGGAHRLTGPPVRGGLEMVQETRETYTARQYGGSSNTVTPLNTSSYSMVHSPAILSRAGLLRLSKIRQMTGSNLAGSCPSYGSMMSPQESQFSLHITELLNRLGISETELILKTTRELNKFLKVILCS